MRPIDQTAALADLMWRSLRCTSCGAPEVLHQGVWLEDTKGLAMAFAQCRRCVRTDPERVALTAMLRRRYSIEDESDDACRNDPHL